MSPPRSDTVGDNANQSSDTDHVNRRAHAESNKQKLSDWENLNYAMSLIVSRSFPDDTSVSMGEVESALEEPAADPPLMDCRVWTAAQWLHKCSRPLLRELERAEARNETSKSIQIQTGEPHDSGLRGSNLNRWNLWKARLTEIATKAEEFGIQEETAKHISKALKAMDTQEKLGSDRKLRLSGNAEL